MKRIALFAVAAMIFTGCEGTGSGLETKSELTTERDKFSYSVGNDLGMQLENIKDEIDLATVYQAMNDFLTEKPSMMTPEEKQTVQQVVIERLTAQAQEEAVALIAEKDSTNAEFFTVNGARAEVTTTESGLQYVVLTPAEGPKPSADSWVKIHYTGKLLDGTTFDSSVDRGEPLDLPLNQVIPGWTEGVQLISVGAKYKLFIPANLAYGPAGSAPVIGPNEALVFEVELIEILEGAPTPGM